MNEEIYSLEDKALLKMIRGKGLEILDVGCGQGRFLIPLAREHDIIGIDSSHQQVKQMKSRGYKVLHTSEQHLLGKQFDCIIMSHVIEHIPPASIVHFFNNYLSLLKSTGHLLIATPLLHQGFYDDYDHIKPYTPKALQILFSDYAQQQEKTNYRLRLDDLWMRRWPLHLNQDYALTMSQKRVGSVLNRCGMLLFKTSGGRIGELTGWVGKFSIVHPQSK